MIPSLGKSLIYLGFFLALVGVLLIGANKIGLPLGKLPGDLYLRSKNFVFQFPITTSIIISIVLTLLINVVLFVFRKQ